jgi:hypothetical protein
VAKLTLLSYGGGQQSTSLLHKYVYDAEFRKTYAPERYLVAMADTGAEHPETYEHVRYTQEFCDKHGIEFHHVTAALGYHTGDWRGGLMGMFAAKSVITSAAFPMASCTMSLKVSPLYKWFEDWIAREYGFEAGEKKALKAYAKTFGEKISVQIGFGLGEESRAGRALDAQTAFAFHCDAKRSDPIWMQESIEKTFPLIDIGFDRTASQEYTRSVGEPVPWPSACFACHWKSDFDVLWTLLRYPDLFARWEEAEDRKLRDWADETFRRARQKKNFQPNGVYKNSPVGGKHDENGNPIRLRQRAQTASLELTRLGVRTEAEQLAWLNERRMRDGHGVRSRAA